MRIHLKTKALLVAAGLALVPLAFAAAVGGSAGPAVANTADTSVVAIPAGADWADSSGAPDASGRATSANAGPKSATSKTDASPSVAVGSASPDVQVPTNSPAPAGATPANAESVSAAYKDLVKSTGAQDVYQNLSADLGAARQALDAGSEEEIAAARKARANGDVSTGGISGLRAAEPPRTEEQMRLDEARASLLANQLLGEVAPWVAGAVLLYIGVKIARYMLLRSRNKAARRHKHRRRMAGPR